MTEALVIACRPEQDIGITLNRDDVIDNGGRHITSGLKAVHAQWVSIQKVATINAPAVGVSPLGTRTASAVTLSVSLLSVLVAFTGLHPDIAASLTASA